MRRFSWVRMRAAPRLSPFRAGPNLLFSMSNSPTLRVGLAGLGTVGASVWRRLASQADLLQQRTGTVVRVMQVAVRRPERARDVGVPDYLVVNELARGGAESGAGRGGGDDGRDNGCV